MDMRKYAENWVQGKLLASTGDLAVILNAGEERESKFGNETKIRTVFLIEHNKEQKLLGMNKTSIREMIKEHGPESRQWVGKVVLLLPVSVQVGNEIKLSVMVKPHRGPIPQPPVTYEELK